MRSHADKNLNAASNKIIQDFFGKISISKLNKSSIKKFVKSHAHESINPSSDKNKILPQNGFHGLYLEKQSCLKLKILHQKIQEIVHTQIKCDFRQNFAQ